MTDTPTQSQDLESLCYLETVRKKLGELEGRIFGCEKAFELGREIGFYSGCIETWTELAAVYPDKINERVLRHINTLKKMISEFPLTNDKDADMFALRDKMKNKMRVITSLLSVQQKYIMTEAPKIVY
ncbi:unnamed protein product [Cunninghamella echinulata]